MINVLDSTKYVLDNSKRVKIDQRAIESLISNFSDKGLKISEISLTSKKLDLDVLLQIIFVFNVINFCFWAKKGESKWTVKIDDQEFDGATALFKCIEEEVERNPSFLEGKELANLSASRLRTILKGNVEIPLFDERLRCLNEVGNELVVFFENSFTNVLKMAKNDAFFLAEILVTNLTNFDDTSLYKGKTIGFYKRAQLNSKMISDALVASGKSELKNLDKLTAFADYKVPQILRNLEVLKYSDNLANKVDSYNLLEKGSVDEVEIRSSSIWAVEFIRQELKKKYGFVTSAHVDSMLWNLSQGVAKGDKPYHRTLTTAY
ncbi:hypothetical protein HY045_01345 [Candidatus Woesebacteria bacterium]|nr:hypothetical protein [Candidatus Woesebacteria bacterium]